MAEPKSITIKNLLGGWPKTRLIRDKQKNVTGVRITANYFTPKGYRLANGCWVFSTLAAGLDMAYLASKVNSLDFAVAAAIGVLLFYGLCRWFWGWVFQKTTIIEMTPTQMTVSRTFTTDRYSLAMAPQFTMEQHDDAWLEARDMEVNRAKRSKLFLDSFYVVMALPGQKAEIATVFKKRRAEALVLRLQLVQQLWETAGDPTGTPAGGPRTRRPDPA